MSFKTFLALDAVPESPGAYFLHDLRGQPLYVGKAKCLRTVLRRHFLPSEDNPLLKDQIGAVRLYPTRTRRQAEEREGQLFDSYLRSTGRYPPGNRHRPPGAAITDSEIVRTRLRLFGRRDRGGTRRASSRPA
jgi:hypothetical protein